MLKNLATIGLLLMSPMALFAQEDQVKIVALVLTTTDYSPSSDNIVASLDALKAQTLLVESPNASELRSVLKRFAAAALENDIALVFADGPILKLGGRDYFAPADLNLRRGSDLLTQAIPISALGRATALAGSGGAVFVHSRDLGETLPEDVSLTIVAPESRPGTSPILLGQSGSDMAMASIVDARIMSDGADLNDLLRDLTSRVEFTVSFIPNRPVNLKLAPVTIPETTSVEGEAAVENTADVIENTVQVPEIFDAVTESDQASSAEGGLNLPQIQPTDVVADESPTVEVVADDAAKPLSVEMLEAIQNGLSRTEKRDIQRGLRDVGFYSGLIDGIFGNQTQSSIEDYQESLGAEVTGVLSVPQLNNFIN